MEHTLDSIVCSGSLRNRVEKLSNRDPLRSFLEARMTQSVRNQAPELTYYLAVKIMKMKQIKLNRRQKVLQMFV